MPSKTRRTAVESTARNIIYGPAAPLETWVEVALRAIARREDRSLHWVVRKALTEYADRHHGHDAAAEAAAEKPHEEVVEVVATSSDEEREDSVSASAGSSWEGAF